MTNSVPAREADLRLKRSIARLLPALLGGAGTLFLCGISEALAQDAGDAPRENIGPFYDIDWSLGLRGSYVSDSASGGHYAGILAPEVSFNRNGERDQTTLSTGGEFSVDGAGQVRTDNVHAGATGKLELDSFTTLDGDINASLTQLPNYDSSLPLNTAVAPLQFTGTAEGSATRNLGHIDVTGRLKGQRFIEGPTTLDDSSTIDNTDQSYWEGAAGLRVGYELTPLVSVFVDGEESYQKFDAASPSLLKYLDGRTSTLSVGASYTATTVLKTEASIGRAWLDYTDVSLGDTATWVANGSVTFNPDETMQLIGSLDTSLGPSDIVPGDTDVETTLNGSARYAVNPWLTLRGSASWDRTVTLKSGDIAIGYSAGAGFDLATSRHVVWTGDYLFAHSDPATGISTNTHTVTVGVRLQR